MPFVSLAFSWIRLKNSRSCSKKREDSGCRNFVRRELKVKGGFRENEPLTDSSLWRCFQGTFHISWEPWRSWSRAEQFPCTKKPLSSSTCYHSAWHYSLQGKQVRPACRTVQKCYQRIKTRCVVAQSCPVLCDPGDCILPGSSVHGVFQGRVLEWVVISSSKESFPPRDRTRVSCIAGEFFTC